MKMKKSIIAVLLATAMLFSSCGAKKATDDTSKAASSNQTDPNIMTPLGKYPEMITVNFAKIIADNPNLVDGQTPEDNKVLDWIRKELNIDCKIAWQAQGSEYANKLSLNVAAGDLPDMFTIPGEGYLTFRQMVDNELLADLSEGYEKCMGDYMKGTDASYNGKLTEPLTIDGKLRAIASGKLGYEQNVLWLRQDWMEKLGLEVPKTIEDVQNILKQFIEKDPGNNGKGNTVGLAVNATTPVGSCGNRHGIEPIFHAVNAFPRTWLKDKDGKIFYGSTAPEVKEGLTIARQMYKDGLIDKQFLTRLGKGETEALLSAGQSGAYFGPWWAVPSDIYDTNKEAKFMAVNAPLDKNGKYNHLTPQPTGDLLAVNSKFENPEAVFKIVNLCFDIYRGFHEEASADLKPIFDKGTSRMALFPIGSFNIDYYDVVPKVGKLTKDLIETGEIKADDTITSYDISQAQYAKDFIDGTKADKNGFKAYTRRYISSNILNAPENNPIVPAYYYSTESTVSIKPQLDKLEDQMYLQIIVGEKPIEYFDEFVEKWHKLGGDTLIQEIEDILK